MKKQAAKSLHVTIPLNHHHKTLTYLSTNTNKCEKLYNKNIIYANLGQKGEGSSDAAGSKFEPQAKKNGINCHLHFHVN